MLCWVAARYAAPIYMLHGYAAPAVPQCAVHHPASCQPCRAVQLPMPRLHFASCATLCRAVLTVLCFTVCATLRLNGNAMLRRAARAELQRAHPSP